MLVCVSWLERGRRQVPGRRRRAAKVEVPGAGCGGTLGALWGGMGCPWGGAALKGSLFGPRQRQRAAAPGLARGFSARGQQAGRGTPAAPRSWGRPGRARRWPRPGVTPFPGLVQLSSAAPSPSRPCWGLAFRTRDPWTRPPTLAPPLFASHPMSPRPTVGLAASPSLSIAGLKIQPGPAALSLPGAGPGWRVITEP